MRRARNMPRTQLERRTTALETLALVAGKVLNGSAALATLSATLDSSRAQISETEIWKAVSEFLKEGRHDGPCVYRPDGQATLRSAAPCSLHVATYTERRARLLAAVKGLGY